jgi:Trypsin-like peptidase domain
MIAAPARASIPQIDQSMTIICGNAEGTGFFYSSSLIVTARHVIKGCTSVILKNANGAVANGSVVYSSATDDIALVSTETLTAPKNLEPIDNNPVISKEPIAVVGTPIDGLVLSQGTVVDPNSQYDPHSMLLDVPADHGNSGGPVFSTKGVVGLVIQKTDSGQIVALNASVITKALSEYQNSKPKSSSSSNTSTGKTLIVIEDNSKPKLMLSIFCNVILLSVIVILILARKKRFSRKKIVINLDQPKIHIVPEPIEEKEKS